MKNQKIETFPVYWKNQKTGKSSMAGVAFYNDQLGAYRLKVDIFANRDIYYLKQKALQGDAILFELEKVIENRAGNFIKRSKVAECVGNKIIEVEIPPYSDYKLVVRLA